MGVAVRRTALLKMPHRQSFRSGKRPHPSPPPQAGEGTRQPEKPNNSLQKNSLKTIIPVFRLLFGCGLGIKRALEQDGVFQLDMVVQIINELAQLFIKFAPAAAGVLRRGEIVGECEQLADG